MVQVDLLPSSARAGEPRLVAGQRTQPVTSQAPSFEEHLQRALHNGIIPQAEHDKQLREHIAQSEFGGGGDLTDSPTRMHGDTHRRDLRDCWEPVTAAFETKKAARIAVKKKQVVHGNNGGDWKYNNFEEGGGCKRYQHCNAHEDCPVWLRIRRLPTGQHMVEVTTRMMHTVTVKRLDRKNSPLTKPMRDRVEQYCTQGYTPKECKEGLQADVVKACQNDCKDPKGGVTGEAEWCPSFQRDNTCTCTLHTHMHTPHVRTTHSRCAKASGDIPTCLRTLSKTRGEGEH